MAKFRNRSLFALGISFLLSAAPCLLKAEESAIEMDALKKELQSLKREYQERLELLNQRLLDLEGNQRSGSVAASQAPGAIAASSPKKGAAGANAFNPAIGLILNGRYSSFSNRDSEIRGIRLGDEVDRGSEGFSLGETELTLSSNVDDKFLGSVTGAVAHDSSGDSVELEEAYAQSLAGLGLPKGMTLRAGRSLWTFGYLNEHHTHADDFADRPLAYRVYLGGAFKDDGLQVSYILPFSLYSEIGGGLYRGDSFPFGVASGSGIGAWSGFLRVGGDIGENQSWRVGASYLGGHIRQALEDSALGDLTGQENLYAADLRYTWAPTGNSHEQEVTLQGEYLWKRESGDLQNAAALEDGRFVEPKNSGAYIQAVYRFKPQWRVGARYSRLFFREASSSFERSSSDSLDFDPRNYSFMIDWSNSEFSRVRFQYSREALASHESDNQFILQYIMSLGAHGAHVY